MTMLKLPRQIAQRIFDDAASAARALADVVASDLAAAIGAGRSASLVVSGGRSPVPFLRALASQSLAWDAVSVTLADERWVDPQSAESNEALVRAHLLRGPAAAARWVALRGPEATPRDGLEGAATRVLAMSRPFDVIVLGMGDDGHTASLFPGAAGLAEAMDPDGQALLTAIDPPAAPHPRISLTLAALLSSRRIVVTIAGDRKRAAIERAAAGADPLELPIAAVLAQTRVPVEVVWAAEG